MTGDAGDAGPGRGLFVTGTDTGVGKTAVAAAILDLLASEGCRIAPLKPVETGHTGPGWPGDAACLREAARSGLPQERIVPYVFEEPLAPNVAARRAGSAVAVERLDDTFADSAAQHDGVLVEGAGGLLVGVTDDVLMADLAARWRLPVLIVARAGLGTLNHTLLTVEAARARGVPVVGVVVNGYPADPDVATRTNPAELARLCGVPVLGVVPETSGVDTGARAWQALVPPVRDAVNLDPVRACFGGAAADRPVDGPAPAPTA